MLGIHPDFRWRSMAQEIQGARRACVSTRLKDDEEIADGGLGKRNSPSKCIERSAKRANDVNRFLGRRTELVGESHRIITLDCLPEIAGSGKMMIHSAIQNEEFFATGNLDIVHARQVDTGFSNQETARLDKKLRSSKAFVLSEAGEQTRKPIT